MGRKIRAPDTKLFKHLLGDAGPNRRVVVVPDDDSLEKKAMLRDFRAKIFKSGRFCIIFDCDGVLIDVKESYDAAIQDTAKYVLKKFAGNKAAKISYRVIEGFKDTGGFNDERHLAYAAIISHVAAENLGRKPLEFALEVIDHADASGAVSVERYLEGLTDISEIKRSLKFDAGSNKSVLHSIFDQIFYGPALYKAVSGRASQFEGPGKIEYDKVLVRDAVLRALSHHNGGKIAMVTGRGRMAAEYSLQGLFKYFDADASMFLEDMGRDMAKPNPKPLLMSMKKMGVDMALYVGDSMEDLMMVKNAQKLGCNVKFCGIVETAHNPDAKAKMFRNAGATAVFKSVQNLEIEL